MVKTASTMLALGTIAPNFELNDVVSGKTFSLNDFSDRQALLMMFICQHCPFVKHIQEELGRIGQDYSQKALGILAISANDVEKYPNDSPTKLQEMSTDLSFNFPLCYDESQSVSKAYTAACTPDFFLFDKDFQLAYRGQLDDSRPSNDIPVTGKDLRQAIDLVLSGQSAQSNQKPSIGCNIKWKPGNEPTYFG